MGSTSLELTFFHLRHFWDKTGLEAFLEVPPKSLQAPTLTPLCESVPSLQGLESTMCKWRVPQVQRLVAMVWGGDLPVLCP